MRISEKGKILPHLKGGRDPKPDGWGQTVGPERIEPQVWFLSGALPAA